MKILLDMNLPPKLAKLLTDRQIPSVHWAQVGAPDASDHELVAYAQENDCIIATCDLDFSVILSITHGQKPSVVQVRLTGFRAEQMVDLLSNALQQNADALEQGAIMTIDLQKARVRLLPL
jgi:predicted nuclease of predicted toxin-antitoxin system